ncbi:MAG TPA: hypothetical protein GX529_08810 [Firmicutes bacterium]|nr:hypothetical protein [Candidatus Fermentithermobacillaceae bacterium]
MAAYGFTKFSWHMAICLAVWIIIDRLSPEGRLYAGFMAAFLGSCYLLAGWLSYLKSTGTDVIARLKRKAPPQVPYFHRRDKAQKPQVWFWGNKHPFDDDLAETAQEHTSNIPPTTRHKLDAMAFALVGLLLMALSML